MYILAFGYVSMLVAHDEDTIGPIGLVEIASLVHACARDMKAILAELDVTFDSERGRLGRVARLVAERAAIDASVPLLALDSD